MKLTGRFARRTAFQGQLVSEIAEGTLALINNGPCPVRFAFCTSEIPIGLFSLESTTEGGVRAIRAWSEARDTWDPFSQLFRPTPPVPQFTYIKPHEPLFLVELSANNDEPVDKVAFSCARVVLSAVVVNGFEHLSFEQADLLGLQIVG